MRTMRRQVQLELGGLLVYDDTSAMGIATAALLQKKRQAEASLECSFLLSLELSWCWAKGERMYMKPVEARGKALRMNGWSYTFANPGDA